LPIALERGRVTMAEIDESVRRVLTLKEQLGLFDDPYRRGAAPESAAAFTHRRRLARAIAARAIVMLKNANEALPLTRDRSRRLAVLGPLADAPADMRGPWWGAGEADGQVSVVAGLRAILPDAEVMHAAGVAIESEDVSGIPAALDLCAAADAILLCVGEGATMSGEAASRAHLGLPGKQRQFAEAVFARAHAAAKPVIVVLFSGRPLVVPWLVEQADAVLAAWFLGSEAGHAIGDVVTGRVSPSGRTPVTWPRALGQIPIFFAERPSGRPASATDHYTSKYLDVPNEPLFVFGHGLTYGRIVYSALRVTPVDVEDIDTMKIRVDVLNEGTRAAEETVFLFTHDKVASVARPLLELKGFAKIHLKPGEAATVTLSLRAAELRFLGLDLEPVFEPGQVEILVGPCADRSRLLAATINLSWSRPC
jgi:beta-glucosidase